MLATFGSAWPNARNLTVSFPADGVSVGKLDNQIGSKLDDVAGRSQWQELALRAYQTWAVHADINVGLRSDYDLDFGTPGLMTGDPRFGEFRIGAIPQTGLSASAVPFQAAAGTYSGDLLLNSNHTFRYHSWENDLGPDPATVDPTERDMFSLLLHEAGNTLGVEDNQLEWSVMFGQYTVPKGVLSPEDIAAIQSIYGARTDPYETTDNGTVQLATLLPVPVGFNPDSEVIRTRASLRSDSDVDVFKIVPLAGRDTATLRIRAEGLSLLQSRVEVLDASGATIANTTAQSVFKNDNTIELTGLSGHSELYVRVSSDEAAGPYRVGDYLIEVDYRDQATQAADLQPGGYDSGPETLFANFGLADSEADLDDIIGSASTPDPVVGTDRYEIVASASSANDVDYYKLTAPSNVPGRFAVHFAEAGDGSADLEISVVDASGTNVGTAGRLRADGTYSIEVAHPVAEQDYYVRVSVDPNSTVGVGNYVAIAEFEAPHSQMNAFISNSVTPEVDEYFRWTASKTRLFRFDLSVFDASSEQAVRLTIYDAHTKQVKMVAVAHSGLTRGALAWLDQGDYILRFTAITTDQTAIAGASFALAVDGLSDDQDDDDYDPDGNSGVHNYTYGNAYGSGDYDYYTYDYDYSYGYRTT